MADLVTLRGGLIVQNAAISLSLDLERRGHVLTAKDGILHVSDGAHLTAEDRAQIPAQRLHLIAIAAYVPPEGEQ